MPTKDEQIDAIMTDLIDDAHDNYRRIIRGALVRAYNRGFEAGCMKAQEQMMEGEE